MEQRRVFLLVAWALLLGVFVWTILPVLTPLVLFLALVYLLTPFFGTALYRRLVVTLTILTLLWLLSVAGSILAPFALALILAYVADPIVDRLERRGLSRGWGAMLVLLVAILALVGALLLLVPLVVHQGQQFVAELPQILDDLTAWYRAQVAALARSNLPLVRELALERALDIDSADVAEWLTEQARALPSTWEAAIGLGKGVQTVLTILGYLILTPVLTFYLLRDFVGLQAWAAGLLPRDRRDATLSFLRRYDSLLGEFLRGQLLVALFVGVTTGVTFWILDFPNAVLLGVVAGIFNIVPYLGLIVSLVPALVIALVTPPVWISLLKVAAVFFGVQSLDGYVLSPRIVGSRVGLHPVWVMLAILAAGSFFGVVGLLLAIPVAVLIKLLIVNTVAAYKKSVYYRDSSHVRDEGDAA